MEEEGGDEDWITQKLASSIVRHGSTDMLDGALGVEGDRAPGAHGPHDESEGEGAGEEEEDEAGDGSFSRAAMKKRAVLAAASQPSPLNSSNAKSKKPKPRVPLPSLTGGAGGGGGPGAKKVVPKKEPPKKESPALPSVLTAADVSSMKGHQIKAQLKARGLPTGGLRPYLTATLEKVLDEEARARGPVPNAGEGAVASESAGVTSVGAMGERAEAVRSQPVKVTANKLKISLLDFAYNPAHVKVPFGATVTFEVEAAELGMVEYQVLIVCKNDEMTLPATRSPPLQRGEKFAHQFVEVGLYEVSDPNYADMRGTVEVYPTPGWEEQKVRLLKAAQAKREAAREADRLEEERQRANERHKFMEDERKWRVDADADAARQRDEESSDPALARAREEMRAAAIAESAAAVSGGWRSKASNRARAREERQRARQAELEVRLAKEAEQRRLDEDAAAVRRAVEQAEAEQRRATEAEARRIREEDERGRLEYERIIRGEATPRAAEEEQGTAEEEKGPRMQSGGGGGSTPRLPSLQPRPPSRGQAAKSAASPRKAAVGSQGRGGGGVGDSGDGSDGGGGVTAGDAAAAADAPLEGVPVENPPTTADADAPPEPDPTQVLIEDCEATPRVFEIHVGTVLTFTVGEEEPEHFEYGFEVHRLSAEDDEEGQLLYKSETHITAGESWPCTFDEAGIYLVTDPDFSPECDVRVVVLAVMDKEEEPGGG